MTTAAEVIRKAGGKRGMICCPAFGHDDKTPSCRVFDGDDGTVRFHCFGGCDWRDVRSGAESLGYIEPYDPSCVLTENEIQERRERAEKARIERERQEAEDSKQAIATARQIWGGTVHV